LRQYQLTEEEFKREYLRPLLGSDLPQPARLRGGAIAKVLKP